MAQEPGTVEQAVARAVRDNLAALQRASDELHQALADLSAACSSTRPSNALPALLRAQSTAASLAASLEVVTRFIAGTSQPANLVAAAAPAPVAAAPAPAVGSAAVQTAADAGREMGAEGGPPPIPRVEVPAETPAAEAASEAVAEEAAPAFEAQEAAAKAEAAPEFDVHHLPKDEQELHRRASRVAKVSMQDIKMLRPNDVKEGRAHRDLVARLRVDIDKARKEYDRRFKAILSHPVDYFYDWMVDVLADGDASALGEYPYPRSTGRR